MTTADFARDLTGATLGLRRRQWAYKVIRSYLYRDHWAHTVDFQGIHPQAKPTGCHQMVATTPSRWILLRPGGPK